MRKPKSECEARPPFLGATHSVKSKGDEKVKITMILVLHVRAAGSGVQSRGLSRVLGCKFNGLIATITSLAIVPSGFDALV